MRLLHYSQKPMRRIKSAVQIDRPTFKPRGLWVSVEGPDDWVEWCEAEEYADLSDQLCYEINLFCTARILTLNSAASILRFTDRFGADPYAGTMGGRTMFFGYAIQWVKVAKDFHGIIISPYQDQLCLDERTHWYYGWDCASGCIWDASAVKSFELIEPAAMKEA